jgi:protein-S-isoprenylcysteine O-methyltransferase Ste14
MALQEELESQGNFLFKYRGYLPLLILVAGIYVFINSEKQDMWQRGEDSYHNLGCLIIGIIGIFIRAYTVGHTPKNTSGRNTSEGQIADELNTTGIYSTVRHPLYLGNYFMWLGVTMLTQNLWFCVAFTLLYWVYYERIMFAEEQFLRRKFSDVYTNWSSKIPAFIPSFAQWVAPRYPFSWKKVIRNEKAGILYLFLLFFLFDNIAKYLKTTTLTFDNNHWTKALIAALLYYIVVKLLSTFTHFFEEEGRV